MVGLKGSIRILLLTAMVTFVNIGVSGQDQPEGIEDYYVNAERYFEMENYHDALPLYLALEENYPKVIEYKLKSAICLIQEGKEAEKALKFLDDVKAKKPKTKELNYWYGRAYHLDYKFAEAISFYEAAIKDAKSSKDKKEINQLIRQAENGKELVAHPVDVELENVGKPVNSEWGEYSPLITSDQSEMIFTYRGINSKGGLQNFANIPDPQGAYYEDVFISKNVDGEWQKPEPIEEINTNYHDATVHLTPDGQKMLIYKDTEANSGDIFLSKLDSNKWSEPERLPFNSEYWEGSASFTPDGRAIIFSSQRPGGLGGIDLWITYQDEEGNWSEPKNLGEPVNTEFDDDGAFMHVDEKSFFFCSKGHSSMGGYDIFETKLQADSTWTAPKNVGYPINTTGDDAFFVVSGDGEYAYYSSGKPGGIGEKDIYKMNVSGLLDLEPVLLVKGNVYRNDTAARASIKVKFENNTVPKGTYYSNKATGDYKINLPLNHYYVFIYEIDGFQPHIETVDATEFKEYTEKTIDVNFYAEQYRKLLTLKGRILYDENPDVPASEVTVLLKSKDGTIQKTFKTDIDGQFVFSNLPADESFMIDLDVNDENLKIDSTIVAIGTAFYNNKPKRGVNINTVISSGDGGFRVKLLEGFDFSKLTAENDKPEEIDEGDDSYVAAIKKFGNQEVPGLIFKVQIGAFNFPENFGKSQLSSLGEINVTVLEDGITRFTIGEFTTLNKAEALRKKAVRKGIDDAFVIYFYNGKRKFLHELINEKIFK